MKLSSAAFLFAAAASTSLPILLVSASRHLDRLRRTKLEGHDHDDDLSNDSFFPLLKCKKYKQFQFNVVEGLRSNVTNSTASCDDYILFSGILCPADPAEVNAICDDAFLCTQSNDVSTTGSCVNSAIQYTFCAGVFDELENPIVVAECTAACAMFVGLVGLGEDCCTFEC